MGDEPMRLFGQELRIPGDFPDMLIGILEIAGIPSIECFLCRFVVLAGLVLVVLLALIGNFLAWQWYFRKGVLVEGRVGHYTGTETIKTSKCAGETVTVYALEYTYAWNDTSYMKVRKVSLGTYNRAKDGDRVKVWLIPEHPTWACIEEDSAFMTLMRKYGGNKVPKSCNLRCLR